MNSYQLKDAFSINVSMPLSQAEKNVPYVCTYQNKNSTSEGERHNSLGNEFRQYSFKKLQFLLQSFDQIQHTMKSTGFSQIFSLKISNSNKSDRINYKEISSEQIKQSFMKILKNYSYHISSSLKQLKLMRNCKINEANGQQQQIMKMLKLNIKDILLEIRDEFQKALLEDYEQKSIYKNISFTWKESIIKNIVESYEQIINPIIELSIIEPKKRAEALSTSIQQNQKKKQIKEMAPILENKAQRISEKDFKENSKKLCLNEKHQTIDRLIKAKIQSLEVENKNLKQLNEKWKKVSEGQIKIIEKQQKQIKQIKRQHFQSLIVKEDLEQKFNELEDIIEKQNQYIERLQADIEEKMAIIQKYQLQNQINQEQQNKHEKQLQFSFLKFKSIEVELAKVMNQVQKLNYLEEENSFRNVCLKCYEQFSKITKPNYYINPFHEKPNYNDKLVEEIVELESEMLRKQKQVKKLRETIIQVIKLFQKYISETQGSRYANEIINKSIRNILKELRYFDNFDYEFQFSLKDEANFSLSHSESEYSLSEMKISMITRTPASEISEDSKDFVEEKKGKLWGEDQNGINKQTF